MISVCILTKNSERTIKKTLDSVHRFPEVVLLDNGSKDNTLSIASQYPNVKIFKREFTGFGELRNIASNVAKNEWILALDSDEVIPDELFREISCLSLDPQKAYSFPRKNFFNGKWIRGCGWYPDRVTRLYNKKHTKFKDQKVHESLECKDPTPLKSPLLHTPYLTLDDFLRKMQHYSTLFAEEHRGKKRSSLFIAISHALFAFIKSYLLKRGIFDGPEGFIISVYNAETAFYKYLKLIEEYTPFHKAYRGPLE